MPELNEKDLDTLFRAAGHQRAGKDLVARVMAQVVVTPIHRASPTPPLIGRGWWVGITAMLVLPILAVLSADLTGGQYMPDILAPLAERLSTLRLPDGDWPMWTLGASSVAFFLMALDQLLGRTLHAHASS